MPWRSRRSRVNSGSIRSRDCRQRRPPSGCGSHGPNKLAAAKKESGFRAFVRQYQDFMQIILLVAAILNAIFTDDAGTTILLAGLTVFNAIIGLRQEAKAEASVEALAQMMKTIARVRRDGQAIEIDAQELVPGDVVLVEAGNRVPADGRIVVAATLEIEEAALTGESLPVGKSVDPVPGEDVPLGDRTCLAYMNTSVTRGRGEMIVTQTGMGTEIGHIADMLANTETEKTPLQKQLDGLSKVIASIAGVALVIVVGDRAGQRRGLRHAPRHGGDARDRGDPDGSARGRHRAALPRDARDRPTERDRQATARRRDPRFDVRDLLRQDRDPHAEQDDGPRAGDPRPEPVHGDGRGLSHRGRDQARGWRPRSTSIPTCSR